MTHAPLKITPRLQWHEGMFLLPQHFQVVQRRVDDVNRMQQSLFHHHEWGVMLYAYDATRLAQDEVFCLSSAQGFMPDGTWFHTPDPSYDHGTTDTIQTLSLSLKDAKDLCEADPVKIYLCLALDQGEASSMYGAYPRYDSIEMHGVADENVAGSVVSIPTLCPKLHLVLGSVPARHTGFPIAEVIYDGRQFCLTSFTPPCPFIEKGHSLFERAEQFITRIHSKIAYLRDKCDNSIGTTFFHETGEQLRPLLRVCPVLEGQILGQRIPTHHLYDILCRVLGDLSTIRLNLPYPHMPIYDHNNCVQVIEHLFHVCETILDSIEQSITTVHFQHKDRLFYLEMQESFFNKDLFIGVKIPSSMAIEDTFAWMRDAVVASDSVIDDVRSKRITGAPRTLLNAEEMAKLGVARGMMIFKLPLCEFIRGGENLNIFNGADHAHMRPQHLVLYMKDRPKVVSSAA